MTTLPNNVPPLDHFFSTSAARFGRLARAECPGARLGGRGAQRQAWRCRAAVEAALSAVRALEGFFAFPGSRLIEDAGRSHRRG